MGGDGASQWQWRQDMQVPAIVIGTVDSLVSKALNRGYGIGRAVFPVDFALVSNGAHWVIDEIQLCPESTLRCGSSRPLRGRSGQLSRSG